MSEIAQQLQSREDRAKGRKIVEKLAAELVRRGFTEEEVGRLSRISMWQGLTKNDDGDAEIHDLYGFQLAPSWDDGPDWPVVQPAAPVKVPAIRVQKRNAVHRTVILPDPQIGYRRTTDGDMIATHDERAMDVALQIAKSAKPDRIVNLGDTLDLPEWSSKFLVLPEFVLTTQPTLDRAHRFLAEQTAIAPEVLMIGGNHDDRIGKSIAKNAMAAFRLRRAEQPNSFPVLSIPFLLRLEDLGVQYVGAYPAGRIELYAGAEGQTPLVAVHGEKLDVVKVAKTERQSFVQGHIHRIAYHSETYEVRGQPETVSAFSPGCLCRVDGAVPSTKSGEDEHGVPVQRWENWQQGMAVVSEFENGRWEMEMIRIHDGVAVWRDKEYVTNL